MKEKVKFSATRVKQRYDAKLPDPALYRTAIGVIRPVIKARTNYHVKRMGMEQIKPPFVVLCNHCSVYDWIYVPIALWPHKLNIVVSNYFFSNPMLCGPLKRIGAIPKDQFTPDVQAIKNILSVAKQGGNITIFPEGRMSPAGDSENFERSTVKLLRHIKLPVVCVKLNGASMTRPKWSKKDRKGRIDIVVKPLFLEGELEQLGDEEAYRRIVEALRTDEFAWQKENHVRFKGADCAVGLENVLYRCPRCGEEMCMRAQGDKLFCEKCGNGATIDEYYQFTPLDESCVIPENSAQWLWQEKAVERERILADENYSYSGEATLLISGEGRSWFTPAGRGMCRADRSGFTFTGTRFGKPYELHIPLRMLPAVSYSPGKAIDLHKDSVVSRFIPDNKQTAQKWSLLIEEFHDVVYGGRKIGF